MKFLSVKMLCMFEIYLHLYETFFTICQVLQDEHNTMQPQYEQFIQAGHSVLDRCDPDSKDAEEITKQLDEINDSWDSLQQKLGKREEGLKDMLKLSKKFYDVLQKLSDWLPDMSDKLDNLSPVSTQPEVIEQQKSELQVGGAN